MSNRANATMFYVGGIHALSLFTMEIAARIREAKIQGDVALDMAVNIMAASNEAARKLEIRAREWHGSSQGNGGGPKP